MTKLSFCNFSLIILTLRFISYLPAIGVPWHRSWACGDEDEVNPWRASHMRLCFVDRPLQVQLVSHFDHIIVAGLFFTP